MPKEISADFAAQLIEQANKAKPKKPRGKTYDFDTRTVTNWFTLSHHMGTCSNEDCTSPEDKGGRNRMVVDVEGKEMCRLCFVAGYNG